MQIFELFKKYEVKKRTGTMIIILGLASACFGLMMYMKMRNDAANATPKTDSEGRLLPNSEKKKRFKTLGVHVSHIILGIGALFTISGFLNMIDTKTDSSLQYIRFGRCAGSHPVQLFVGIMLLLGGTNIVLDKALDDAVKLYLTNEIILCIAGVFVMRYGLFIRNPLNITDA